MTQALHAADPSRNIVAFVNSGHTGGEIDRVINQLAATARDAGKNVQILESGDDLLTVCPSTLRGTTPCYGAVTFRCSPTEGSCAVWNYTLTGDGYFGTKIYVHNDNNDAEVYTLPFQRAIDEAIVGSNGTASLPQTIFTYPFTSETQQGRDDEIRHLFMNALINFLGVAFFVGIVGVVYHLTGQMASERELGLSQLIEAMTPNTHVWYTQAARLISNHLAFDLIYLPSWLVMAGIIKVLVFTKTSAGIIIGFHILIGLALSSWSVLGASFFRKSQLSGISVTMVSVILAIIAQVQPPNSSGAIALTTLLFPPMGYVYFTHYMARWEYQSLPTNMVKGAPNSPWQLPGIAIWILFIISIIVFPIIAGFVERWLHGTASKSRKLNFHPADPSKPLQLSSFSKEYRPGWWGRLRIPWLGKKARETVLAVNNLTMTALQGQIFVLLGANGSGKSTTLDAISGLTQISGGTIEIDGTGGLGLCPQKNVMWDELTVFEHIQIFNKLKNLGKPDHKQVLDDLVAACDLQLKRNAKAKTLSGGQKRKLQLAMMFTGGSRVCCIDEVSSGLDPLSRRKIWDILLKERGRRTLLLTTHYLDEPEALADHIAILSKGNLMAEGSAVELKQRYGGGYKIHIGHLPPDVVDSSDNWENKVAENGALYHKSNSAEAAAFIAELDEKEFNNYQVVGPTIEDVFLRLAQEVNHELHEPAPVVVPIHASSTSKKSEDSSEGEKFADDSEEKLLQLHDGRGTSLVQQSWILFRKRLTIVRRTNWPYIFAVLIPIITAGLVTFFLHDFDGLSCTPGAQVRYTAARGLNVDLEVLVPYGPPSLISVSEIATLAHQNQSEFHQVSSLEQLNSFVDQRYANVTPGGFFVDGSTPTLAYQGDAIMAFPFITQSFVNQIMSRVPIVAQYQSFAWPWAPKAGDTLQLILYFGLAMSVFPALFALYPTVERLRNVRALHYSNGIRAGPLWAAYTLFDFLWVLLVSAVVTIIFAAVSDVWYHIEYLFVVFFLYGLSAILVSYCVSLFVSSSLAAFAFAAGGQAVLFLIYFITFMCIVTYTAATQIDQNILKAQWALGLFFPSGNLLRSLFLTLNEFSTLCRGDHPASYPGDWNVYGGPIFYLLAQSIALFTFLVWWDSGYKPSFLNRSKDQVDDEEDESNGPNDPDVAAEVARVKHSNDGLRVLHLTKSFGKNLAVDDVSFGVPHGETFALLGPNGAGKSTTISLIRGDTRPSHRGLHRGGDVLVQSSSILEHRAGARSHLGVCPQFDSPDLMTVEEHLRFYARARGVADAEHNTRAIISAVGLEAFANRMAGALSGGNKRKLSLGIALTGNPSVLLLDEPSSGMDAASKRIMWRTLGAIAGGRSLVITTHSMEEADALADRAGIMAGKMLALGSIDQLRNRYGNAYHVHVVLKGAPHVDDEEAERVKSWVKENVKGAVTEDKVFHGQLRFSVPNESTVAWTESSDDVVPPQAPEISPVNDDVKSLQRDKIASSRVRAGQHGVSIAGLFALLEKNKGSLGFEYYSVGQTTLDQVFLTIVGRHNVEEEGHREDEKEAKGESFITKVTRLPKR